MKTVLKAFGILLMSASLITGCNKDDKYDEPADVVTLNMSDEDNGRTRLGKSDVYINKSNNFQTSSTMIADLGSQKGIGARIEPQLGTLATEVAVTPGHLYHIFVHNTLATFPSGMNAIQIGEAYYKAYVVSPIQVNNKLTGAVVQYILAYPDLRGLPKVDTQIGVVNNYDESISMSLPEGAECVWGAQVKQMFVISTENGRLTMTPKRDVVLESGIYDGAIRVDYVYTTVTLKVVW